MLAYILNYPLLRNVIFFFQELGLLAGTPVGTSLIDAHAGGVGVMESVPVEPGSTGYFHFFLLNSMEFLTHKSFSVHIIHID